MITYPQSQRTYNTKIDQQEEIYKNPLLQNVSTNDPSTYLTYLIQRSVFFSLGHSTHEDGVILDGLDVTTSIDTTTNTRIRIDITPGTVIVDTDEIEILQPTSFLSDPITNGNITIPASNKLILATFLKYKKTFANTNNPNSFQDNVQFHAWWIHGNGPQNVLNGGIVWGVQRFNSQIAYSNTVFTQNEKILLDLTEVVVNPTNRTIVSIKQLDVINMKFPWVNIAGLKIYNLRGNSRIIGTGLFDKLKRSIGMITGTLPIDNLPFYRTKTIGDLNLVGIERHVKDW